MPTPDFNAWFTVRAVREPGAVVTAAALYDDYRTWLEFHRPTALPLSLWGFQALLGERGIWRAPGTSGGRVVRQGVRLQPWPPHEPAPLEAANEAAPDPVLEVLRRIRAGVVERGAVLIAAGEPLAELIDRAVLQAELA